MELPLLLLGKTAGEESIIVDLATLSTVAFYWPVFSPTFFQLSNLAALAL